MALKDRVQPVIASRADVLWWRFQEFIGQAVDAVAQGILDEAKLEEAAASARAGATYTVVAAFAQQMAEEGVNQVMPVISQVAKEFGELVTEAAKEAVSEMVMEEVQKRAKTRG